MTLFPSLKTIAFLRCDDLRPDIRMLAAAGLPVAVDAQPEVIRHFGKAGLSGSLTPSSLSGSSKLSFSSASAIIPGAPVAFIAEDHNGSRWLIGAFEPPFPEIEQKFLSGVSPKDQARIDFSVSWQFPPVKVAVWLPGDADLPVS